MSRDIVEISGIKLRILKVLWAQQLDRRDGKFTYPYLSVGKVTEHLGNDREELGLADFTNAVNKVIVQLEEMGGLGLVEGIKIKDDEYYQEDPVAWKTDLEEFYSKFESEEEEYFEETKLFKLSNKGIYYCETVLDLSAKHGDFTPETKKDTQGIGWG